MSPQVMPPEDFHDESEVADEEEEDLPAQQISLPLIEANCLSHISKNADPKE